MQIACAVAATALLCAGLVTAGALGAVELAAGGVFVALWVREVERG
jgi:hypothetical protein